MFARIKPSVSLGMQAPVLVKSVDFAVKQMKVRIKAHSRTTYDLGKLFNLYKL